MPAPHVPHRVFGVPAWMKGPTSWPDPQSSRQLDRLCCSWLVSQCHSIFGEERLPMGGRKSLISPRVMSCIDN